MTRLLHEVLVPTDFSPRSLDVARYAVAVARLFHSKLTLLHVSAPVNLVWGGVWSPDAIDELMRRQKEENYTRLNSLLPDNAHGVGVQRLVVEGDPAQVIAEYAAAQRVDLIMMPTRGCSAFRRFLLGSVTAKVLHDVSCPVWTSSHVNDDHSARFVKPKVIACAIDSNPEGDAILRWASELAADLHARVIVIHAIPELQSNPVYILDADLRRDLVSQAHTRITKVLQDSRAPGAEIRIEGGSVSSVVCSAAEDNKADLLVIGRALDQGMLGRLRTHAYTLIRESPCPVISI